MANANIVILIGNLTKDPELKYTPGGSAVCSFSVAVNKKWTGKDGEKKEDVAFIECEAWQKTAEIIAEYLKKGSPIYIEGELKQDRWEKEGQKHSKIKVKVSNVQFLGKGQKETKADEETSNEISNKEDIPF